MSLAAQDLSSLLKRQGDYFAARIALEVDLSVDGLGDENILLHGYDFERLLVGALDVVSAS